MDDDQLLLAEEPTEALATEEDSSSLATAELDDTATDEQEVTEDEAQDPDAEQPDPRKEASYRGRYEQERKQREAMAAELEQMRTQVQQQQQIAEQVAIERARFQLDQHISQLERQHESELAQYARAWQAEGHDDRSINNWVNQYRQQFERQRQAERQQIANQLQSKALEQRLVQMETATKKQEFVAHMVPQMQQEAKDLYGVDIAVSPAEVLKRIANAPTPEAAEVILVRYRDELARQAKSGPQRRQALKQAAATGRFNVPGGNTSASSFDAIEARIANGTANRSDWDQYSKLRQRRAAEGVPGFN